MLPSPFSESFLDSPARWTCEQSPLESYVHPLASSWLTCTHFEDSSFADMTTSIAAAFHSLRTGIISWAAFNTNSHSTFGQLWAESRSLSSWNKGWCLECGTFTKTGLRIDAGGLMPPSRAGLLPIPSLPLCSGLLPEPRLLLSHEVHSLGLRRMLSLLWRLHGLRR